MVQVIVEREMSDVGFDLKLLYFDKTSFLQYCGNTEILVPTSLPKSPTLKSSFQKCYPCKR